MARQQALLALARQLDAAAAADNWTTLAAVNRAMAESLTHLSAQGPWDAQEKAALLVLRAAHGNAYQHTSKAKDKLGVQLSDMQANKEGWIAYALHGSDSDGNPA